MISAVGLKKICVPPKINVGASECLKNNLMKKHNFSKLTIADCRCRVDIISTAKFYIANFDSVPKFVN